MGWRILNTLMRWLMNSIETQTNGSQLDKLKRPRHEAYEHVVRNLF
jgi:hypothetical protein